MNPLYQMLNGGFGLNQAQNISIDNPMALMNAAAQAMQNPAWFIKQQFSDIPNEIANDPNQILGYLQQTRGITNSQIQQLRQLMQNFPLRPFPFGHLGG